MVFSGALFPPTTLPWPVSAVASALPYTFFISAARDAIVYGLPADYVQSLVYCLIGGLLMLAACLRIYLAAEGRARRDGVLDRRLA